jgi:hypothetical protein
VSTRADLDDAYSLDPVHERMLEIALVRDGRSGARWRALRSEIDLDRFWDGKALDLLPLVYRALVDEGVDHADLARLRGAHRRTWYDNQLRFQRVGRALRVLADASVEGLVLKGVALALLVYPDAGLRPMQDCDVLIRPGQTGRALRALGAAGWTPEVDLPSNFARRHQEIDVFDADGNVIDLHWHVSQWLVRPGDEWRSDDEFWARSVPLEVAGVRARALDPTDTLLHVLVHGARNGWRDAPQWVVDAVMLHRRWSPIEWDRIADLARDRGVAYPVRRGLAYLADRFDVPVPVAVLDRLNVPLRRRARRMFARTGRSHDPSPTARRWLGPLAGTYAFWVTESAPLRRLEAMRTFPGWLADHWRVDGPWQLPAAAAKRLLRRVRRRGLSTRRAP